MQVIESKHAQDRVLCSVNTKELLKHGWPESKKGSLKSVSAAYLGGLLLGKKCKELKGRIILDSGLIPSTKGSRIYAGVKGLADSGIDINYNKKVLPAEDRIKGEHIGLEEFEKIREKIGFKKIVADENISNNQKNISNAKKLISSKEQSEKESSSSRLSDSKRDKEINKKQI